MMVLRSSATYIGHLQIVTNGKKVTILDLGSAYFVSIVKTSVMTVISLIELEHKKKL